MSPRGIYLVTLAALTTVAANLLMRGSVLRSGGLKLSTETLVPQLFHLAAQPMFVAGAFLYGLSAIIWFSVISTEPLSTAYPVLVSMTFVMVTAGSVLFFAERVSAAKGAGILIILAGIWIVASR
jgi:multidrug transporter EmrE-like cation transporter